jgi:hypothetical protein
MIAILISGAVRNLSETWPENKKHLDLLNQPYEVFVHSWTKNFGTPRKVYKDENRSGYAFGFRERVYQEKDFEVTQDYIKSIIPNAKVYLEPFNEDEIIAEFDLAVHINHKLFRNLINSVAMYQGITRVFSKALNEEGADFSHFVRLRSDFLLSSEIPLNCLNYDIYFGGPGVNPGSGYVSDQFLVVSPKIASKLVLCESELINYIQQNGWGLDSSKPFYGERILSKFLSEIRQQSKVCEQPIIGAIKRPKIVSAPKSFSVSYLFELFDYNLNVLAKKTSRLAVRIIRLFFRA